MSASEARITKARVIRAHVTVHVTTVSVHTWHGWTPIVCICIQNIKNKLEVECKTTSRIISITSRLRSRTRTLLLCGPTIRSTDHAFSSITALLSPKTTNQTSERWSKTRSNVCNIWLRGRLLWLWSHAMCMSHLLITCLWRENILERRQSLNTGRL